MTKMQRIALPVMGIAVAAGFGAPALGQEAASSSYALLELQGQNVKWGASEYGTPASVTYALLTKRLDREGRINCRSMEPLSPSSFGSADTAGLVEQIEDAFASWERRAAITFIRIDDEKGADIVIGAQRIPRGIAYASVRYEVRAGSLTSIRRAAICLNPDLRWETSFDGDPGTPNVHYVIQHEIGHAIGLDHPGRDGTVMGYAYAEIYTDLAKGDIDGAAYLYGRRGRTTPGAPPSSGRAAESRVQGDDIALSTTRPVCEDQSAVGPTGAPRAGVSEARGAPPATAALLERCRTGER